MSNTNELVADQVAADRRPQAHAVTGTVLVAVDFSDTSQAALLWACDYAAQTGARIEVLHVVHDPADAPGTYKPRNGDALQPMADAAKEMAAEFIDQTRQDHPEAKALETARMLVKQGLPVTTIVDTAERRGAELIVMGCRGRNALQRLLLGSTAERVLERSRIPVTVVKTRHSD